MKRATSPIIPLARERHSLGFARTSDFKDDMKGLISDLIATGVPMKLLLPLLLLRC